MAIPTDSAEINSKIANGDVKVKKRSQKKEAEHTDVPKAIEKKKKAKPAKKAEPEKVTKELVFPAEGFVNDYGFLKIRNKVLEKIGWPVDKKFDVTIDFVDGALVIKKKAA